MGGITDLCQLKCVCVLLCLPVQMRGGSVCSLWPHQQMAMRSWEGEYNLMHLCVEPGLLLPLFLWCNIRHNHFGRLGPRSEGAASPYSFLVERTMAASTSLILSRRNGRWRLVCPTVFALRFAACLHLFQTLVHLSCDQAEPHIIRPESFTLLWDQWRLTTPHPPTLTVSFSVFSIISKPFCPSQYLYINVCA